MEKFRTIILEDDMVARMILENYCRNHPHIDLRMDFDDSSEAVLYLSANTVDLVFLDIQLRQSSGFDIIRYLSPGTRVIVTTASAESAARAAEYGLTDILMKPISLENFLWSIKKIENSSSPV